MHRTNAHFHGNDLTFRLAEGQVCRVKEQQRSNGDKEDRRTTDNVKKFSNGKVELLFLGRRDRGAALDCCTSILARFCKCYRTDRYNTRSESGNP
jgi:hypothetical protein